MRGTVLPATVLALALGGCSFERLAELTPNRSAFSFSDIEFNPYSKASMAVPTTFAQPPLTAGDYVNADGSCAAAEANPDQQELTAVALQMPECTVVQRLGAPERVEIGANERGERSVKLLYSRGDRPGLYSFTAGRLVQIQRVAEPEPPKPQKKPAAKPRRSVG
jgi:hypothetical protein